MTIIFSPALLVSPSHSGVQQGFERALIAIWLRFQAVFLRNANDQTMHFVEDLSGEATFREAHA